MNIENNKKALDALERINKILNEVRDLFPFSEDIKERIKKDKGEVKHKKPPTSEKILKRVNGIITNFNEQNAERKLKSLLAFLACLKK